jgi:cellulose biosynthesis protein BcsQ
LLSLMMIAEQAFYHKISEAFVQMQERMKHTIRAVDRSYDQVVIDCAPGLSQLVWGALRASDIVFIPYIPDRTAEDNVGWLAQRLRVLGHPKFFTIANRVSGQDSRAQGIVSAIGSKYRSLGYYRFRQPSLWRTRSITWISLTRWHRSSAQRLST